MVNCNTEIFSKIKKAAIVVFLMVVVVLCILSFIPDSPVGAFLLDIFYKLMDMNIWICIVVVFVINVICVVFMIPATPVTIFSGIRFGTWIGLCVSQMGCFVGSVIVYGITRFFLFDMVDKYIQKNKLMRSIQKIVEKHGILFITLIRASPLFPFPIINYILPPVVTFMPYAIGSFIGLIPSNFFVVYIASSITDIAEAFTTNTFQASSTATMIIIIVLTIALIVIVTVYIKRELKKLEREEQQEMNDEENKVTEGTEGDQLTDIVTIESIDNHNDHVEIIKQTLVDDKDDHEHHYEEDVQQEVDIRPQKMNIQPKKIDSDEYTMKHDVGVIIDDDDNDDDNLIQVNDDDDALLIDPNA